MNTYKLIDSGEGRKLEQIGPYLIDRQCAVAFWKKRMPYKEWKKADAVHQRSETGGGHWEFNQKLPESWVTEYGELKLKTKLTSFGHLGFFAEQINEWNWFRSFTSQKKAKVLNLFAYTGGSSMALAQAGCEVTHVDAAKGVVDWSRQNAELNKIPEGGIRYIVDDCLTYMKREERRGKKYDGIVLDPPSYGRGPNGEVFKIENDINEILDAVFKILVPSPLFVHFSCHSPGFTPQVLQNLLSDRIDFNGMEIKKGEMFVQEEASNRPVPSGTFCKIFKK